MKILQLCNKSPFPLKDGGALAIHNMAKSFAELGHEVTILSMHTRKHYYSPRRIREYFSALGNIRIELVEVKTNINPAGLILNLLFSRLPYTATRFITGSFRRKLAQVLKSDTFNVVQFEGLYLAPYTETVKTHSKAFTVLRAHNVEHEIWQRQAVSTRNPFRRMYISNLANRIRKFESEAINGFDALVPITGRDGQTFVRMGFNKKMYICPFGYDLKIKLPATSREKGMNRLFFIGSLDWLPNREGLRWFIENVWQGIRRTKPGVSFSVAGRNAPGEFIRYLEANNVVYSGEVDDAREFMQDKDIMVAPLLSGSGIRVKIIEAMAMKRTVITTSIGAEGIEAADGEHLVIADDPGIYTKRLADLLDNQEDCREMGEKACRFVKEELDNTKLVSGLMDFYLRKLP